MFDENRQPIFTAHGDPTKGDYRITVDQWTPEMFLEPKLLEANLPEIVRCDDGVVTFTVANGEGRYRITGWDAQRQALTLRLLWATLDG